MMRSRPRSLKQLCLQIAEAAIRMSQDACAYCSFSRELLRTAGAAVRNPRKVRWRTVAYYMDDCGSDAMPIIALLGFLIGVILAFQAIVQLGRFGVENYVVNLVGTVIVTELAPLVTAVVLAGRTGSSFAAELGLMKAAEEIDALVTMGMDTGNFLLFPKILALILVLPGLTIISDVCGIVGGMVVVTSMLQVSVAEYFIKTFEVIQPIDLLQGVTKSMVFALIVGSIGCMRGLLAERDAQSVGKSATSAVVSSIFLIVVADALMTGLFGVTQ